MVSLLGIILSIALIIVLAFKKVPLYVYAPLCAAIAALFSKLNPYEVLTTSFTQGIGSYVSQNFFPAPYLPPLCANPVPPSTLRCASRRWRSDPATLSLRD